MKPIGAKPKVLFVDDEPHVLEGISLHLGRKTTLLTATSGLEALEHIAREPDIAVIVSDMRMPHMTGAVFLAHARKQAPDAVRVLLTGQADLSSAIAAVNEGGIFRFLMKPCAPPVLLEAVEAAAEQHRLIVSERVLLEQTLRGSVQTLTEVLALTHPQAFGRAQRIRRLAGELAHAMELPQAWQVEVAAMLRHLGSLTLPNDLIEKLDLEQALSEDERAMAARIPALTQQLLAHIPRLEGVCAIIAAETAPAAHVNDAHREIHMCAQALRAAVAFDRLELSGHEPQAAIALIGARPERFGPEVLGALGIVRGGRVLREELRDVATESLEVGMVLAEEVRMSSGALLVPRGFEITNGFLERVRNFQRGTIPKVVRVAVMVPVVPVSMDTQRKDERWHTMR